MNTFRSIRALAPVVRVGEERSNWGFFALSLGSGAYFDFRYGVELIELLDAQMPIPVPDAIGVRGLFRCIVERRVALPRKPTDFPVRLPSFSDWWDGTDEELFAIMLILTTSGHEVEAALQNAAYAIKTTELVDRIIADSRFPASTSFTAFYATATETAASIEQLCAYANAHDHCTITPHELLKYADPLIQLLTRRGELERIRPAIERAANTFGWQSEYSRRPHILEAIRIFTQNTR